LHGEAAMLDKPAFPYGAGFRSLTEEIPAPVALEIDGALPAWLKGSLLRTGPSKFEVGARTYNHWFDGLAMLHAFTIVGGRVTYMNRFLESKAFRAAKATGEIAYAEFATDPCRTLFGRVAAIFDPKLTDNCCVNVSAYARDVAGFTETTLPLRFSPDTLATLGVFGYARALRGQVSTAHRHYDAARRCHYNYVVDFGMNSAYRICKIGDDGKQTLVASLPVERPAYMHSFAMSTNHLVLTEFPLVVNPLDLRLSGKPFIRNYRWAPERGLVFHVVEKDSGKLVRTATADACFAFHHVNSFEDHGRLAIDVVVYPDAAIIDQLYLAPLRSCAPITATGTLTRFHVLLEADAPVTRRALAEVPIELPRINYGRHAGQPYRYVWGTGIQAEGDFLDSIVKVDTTTATVARWHASGLYPGEPVFVPSPAAAAEDDGVLLSIVLDTAKQQSFLLVLDAASLAEMARAAIPHAIPFHFHGNFFPSAA
jgi:carotenoid cleavage dioxygenase-like enzyme